MTPAVSPLERTLDAAHASGREVFLANGRLWLVLRPDRNELDAVQCALVALHAELTEYLQPWRCGLCQRPAELPDYCTHCATSLRRWSRGGR